MLTISFQMIRWNTLRFVDEVSAQTHEKVALQNPDIKLTLCYNIEICVQHVPAINIHISLMLILKYMYIRRIRD